MKRIILARLRDSEKLSVGHTVMFHGAAFRDGALYPFNPSATWFNDVRSPLELVHSKQLLPDIFQPAENLVVSEAVVDSLNGLHRLAFLPVVFEKLVDFYFEKGVPVDFSFKVYDPDVGEMHGAGNYLLSLPDDPDAHEVVPPFFEILVPKDHELTEHYENIKRVEIGVEPPECDLDPLGLRYSQEMLEEHSIIRSSIYPVFSPQAFSLIEPFLDRDYFHITEVDLD